MTSLVRHGSSVRARLTLSNTLTFAFVLVTLGVAFRFLAHNYLLNALDREIRMQAQRFQAKNHVEMFLFSGTSLKGKPTVRVLSPANKSIFIGSPEIKTQYRIVSNMDVSRGEKSVEKSSDVDNSGQFLYRSFDLEGKPLAPLPPKLPFDLPAMTASVLNASGLAQEKKQTDEARPWDKAGFVAAVTGKEHFAVVDWEGTPLRVFSLPLREMKLENIVNIANSEDGDSAKGADAADARAKIIGVAQIAAPLGQVHRDIAGLTHLLLLTLPLALLVAACAGVFLTGRALRPVKALALAATHLRPDQLSQRLPVSGADEFDELASTFNRALDRVELAFVEREKAMEQLRRFTADASHELRTPLTTIKANTGVALKETEPSGEHLHALRQIDRAADRMTALVRDLLLLARADAEQIAPDLRPLLLEEVLQDAIDALSSQVHTPILLEACEQGLTVCGEAEPLCRLFLNLLENAARYTPLEGRIQVTLTRQAQQACVRVQDTGCGIAPAHLPHLGERFYRADSGRNRKQGGAGLGLAICRSIVARHQGTLAIESEPGQGTTVTVCLPLNITDKNARGIRQD